MEALMWRASDVVISYGAVRGEAKGASGTHEKEKKSSSKGSFEKARLGEKSPAAAAKTSGNNGRGFTLAPLPFPSAKNLVPMPLHFLWFPESKDGNIKIREIGDYLQEDAEQDANRLYEEGKDSDNDVHGGLRELGPDLGDSTETDGSVAGESQRSEDEVSRFEGGTVSKRWYQNILAGSFLKKSPKIKVKIPSTEMFKKADESMTSSTSSTASQITSIEFDSKVKNLQQVATSSTASQITLIEFDSKVDNLQQGDSAACALGDAGKCIGCAAESKNYVVDPPPSSPLAILAVPHVNVTHDLESFLKFLSEVSLTELKIIAQTSVLSNLAYVIPKIKVGELARYHCMLFVTSSIDIKAEAHAKEKAEALAQEKAVALAKSLLLVRNLFPFAKISPRRFAKQASSTKEISRPAANDTSSMKEKPWYPLASEIFKTKGKFEGRTLLAQYKDAYDTHLINFRRVRSWFSSPESNEEQLLFLKSDFKKETVVKERCRAYIELKMKELNPLQFKCPHIGSTHSISWPYDFVYKCVLSRKHEWRNRTWFFFYPHQADKMVVVLGTWSD